MCGARTQRRDCRKPVEISVARVHMDHYSSGQIARAKSGEVRGKARHIGDIVNVFGR